MHTLAPNIWMDANDNPSRDALTGMYSVLVVIADSLSPFQSFETTDDTFTILSVFDGFRGDVIELLRVQP